MVAIAWVVQICQVRRSASVPSALFRVRDLIGKVLVRERADTQTSHVTETEAWLGEHDLASHSARVGPCAGR